MKDRADALFFPSPHPVPNRAAIHHFNSNMFQDFPHGAAVEDTENAGWCSVHAGGIGKCFQIQTLTQIKQASFPSFALHTGAWEQSWAWCSCCFSSLSPCTAKTFLRPVYLSDSCSVATSTHWRKSGSQKVLCFRNILCAFSMQHVSFLFAGINRHSID